MTTDTTSDTAPDTAAPFSAEDEINETIAALADHLAGTAMAGDQSPERIPDYRYPCGGALALLPRSLPLIAAWSRDARNQHDGVVGPRFVLGSQDAEMAWIEKRLRRSGDVFFYGAAPDRRTGEWVRVAPGQRAVGLLDRSGRRVDMSFPYDHSLIPIEVTVECGEETITPIIDHHADGDARTSAPPHLAWIASSAGQIAYILANATGRWAWTDCDTAEAVLVGESDHNLPAFVAGQCFTPAPLARRYVMVTRWQTFGAGTTWEDFCAAVARAEETLRCNAGLSFADLRHLSIDGPPAAGTGEVYPSAAQYLPVASALCGIPYAVHIKRRDGKLALRLGGFPAGAAVLQFFRDAPAAWGCLPANAPAPDNAYCFVERGMGGGTLIAQGDL